MLVLVLARFQLGLIYIFTYLYVYYFAVLGNQTQTSQDPPLSHTHINSTDAQKANPWWWGGKSLLLQPYPHNRGLPPLLSPFPPSAYLQLKRWKQTRAR